MSDRGRILVGTSGWQYAHWRGVFYPADLPKSRWLAHYAGRLGSVEINTTFYGLPGCETVHGWRDAVSPGFVFAAKASRYVTHMKKLKNPEQTLPPLFEALEPLGSTLGVVLFQLPPNWKPNPRRLAEFLEVLRAMLPDGTRAAFELRDRRWETEEVLTLLAKAGAGFCVWELAGERSPVLRTASIAYVRLHGPQAQAYRGRYGRAALEGWAERLRAWAAEGADACCYFDNDEAGYAALNALELAEILGPSEAA